MATASGVGPNRPGPETKKQASPADAALIQDLLRKPPTELATWALEQVEQLSQPGTDVEKLPVFQLAGALRTASAEDQQALVRGAMSGLGELPAPRRAEAIRLAIHTASRASAASQPSRSASPELSRAQASEPLAQNFLRVVEAGKFNDLTREEQRGITQVAQVEAAKLVQSQQLLDVVAELDEQEREQLAETLVEARVVPEEQRGVLEEAVRPGGYADKLSGAMVYVRMARKNSWVLVAMPVVELLLGALFSLFECGSPLSAWLRFDALLALLAAAGMFLAGHVLTPVYAKLEEDPIGVVQRWQMAAEDTRDWRGRLEMAIPEVDFETYRLGGIGIAAFLVCVLLGAIWAVVGTIELIAACFVGCNGCIILFSILFIGVRFGAVVAAVALLFYVLDEVHKHRSRSPLLGSTLLPMSEDALPKGQFQMATRQ